MKVSIITVAYNSAATIGDTLLSVASQSHPDIEHLVIDGASQDATLQVLARHGARVARVVSEPDAGIYDAMNKGLALATGDLVGFLNADDVFAGDHAVAAMVSMARRTRAQALYGDLVYVRQSNPSCVVRYWRSGGYDRRRLKFGWMPPHPTFYLRREALEKVGAFNTGMRIAADYDFILRCLNQGDIAVHYIPRVLVRMRTGGASNHSVRALWRKSREDLQALRRNNVGGISTLLCKNMRKLPQLLGR